MPAQKQEKLSIKDFLDLKGKGFKGSISPTKILETDAIYLISENPFSSESDEKISIRKVENADGSETILAFLEISINGSETPTELRGTQRWLSCLKNACANGLNPKMPFHQQIKGKSFGMMYEFTQVE